MTTATRTRKTASTADKAARVQAREQLAAQLRDDLEQKVAELATEERWLTFLEFAQAFHSYSLNNVLLILAQHPTADTVAGFRKWQELGRQVRKGEKAIRIYGYSSRTVTDNDPATGDEIARKIPTYPILSVFAHDQTDPIDGFPTPEHPAQRLTGADSADIYSRTETVLTGRGWTIERDMIAGETNGYTTRDGSRRVVIDAQLSPAQAAKTILHEAAHVVLHTDTDTDELPLHRGVIETEAESVAYVLSGLFGLDTSAYSVGYIAGWANADTDLIKATATRVLTAVRDLAAALDPTDDTAAASPTATA